MYSEQEARKLILSSIVILKEKELLAFTWGNISARISKDEFIITPSGIPFEKITFNDLVKVNMNHHFNNKETKPSSQTRIHASIYKMKDDCNFIIHTHQNYASILSLDKYNPLIPVAKYARPSTTYLARNVVNAIKNNPDSTAVLLSRHGIVSFDNSFEKCYENLKDIERLAIAYYRDNQTMKDPSLLSLPYLDDYAQVYGNKHKNVLDEDKDLLKMISFKNTLAANFNKNIKPLSKLNTWYQHFKYVNHYSKLKNK